MSKRQQKLTRCASVFALSVMLVVALPVAAKKKLRAMDLDCAVETVTERTGGKVLAAEESITKKGKIFRIKVLTPRGHVRYVRIRDKAKCEY